MDDLQAQVERNASGRESEARHVESILRAEVARFERWLGAQDVVPTIAAMRERADRVVDSVLAENRTRWEGLTDADEARLRTAARAIASRLLHEPTLRLKRSAEEDDSYVLVAALRELFALDGPAESPEGGSAEVADLRERQQSRRGRGGH